MLFYSGAVYSFENLVKNHRDYVPHCHSHESYLSLLRCLLNKADTLKLTTYRTTDLETTLQPYLLAKHRDLENNCTTSTYPYTSEIFSLLSSYENFFAYEDSLELQFTVGDTYLLGATPHHAILSINAEYFCDIDPTFIEAEKREREVSTPLYQDALTTGHLYRIKEDEWQKILPKLFNTGDTISFGEEPQPFTEEIFHQLQTLPTYFAKEIIQIYRDGYLTFSSNKAEHIALVDLSFVIRHDSILREHHPLPRSYRTFVHDYTQAKEYGKLYSPESLSLEEYRTLLEKLFLRCDDLCLITSSNSSPIRGGNVGNAPEYPGTYERDDYTVYHYPLSDDIFNVFLTSQSFFSFGENIDIVFSRKQKTVLYTDSSKHLCVIDLWFLEETTEIMRFETGGIMSEAFLAILMNANCVASREEYEKIC